MNHGYGGPHDIVLAEYLRCRALESESMLTP